MKKRLSKTTLALLLLSLLTFTAIIAPVAKADGPTMTLSLYHGTAGTRVMASLTGFRTNYPVNIEFGTENTVGTAFPESGYGVASAIFTVPQVAPGTYTVTATGNIGGVATAIFTVTQGLSTTPNKANPTGNPATVPTGFLSLLLIVVILAVIAFAILMTIVYIRRGKQETSADQEALLYEPRTSTPSKKPATPSKIYQPSKINQSTIKSQQPPSTMICRHCKRAVRDDLNICPYCSKRLR